MAKFIPKKKNKKNSKIKFIKNFIEKTNIIREKLKWFDPFTYVDLFIMPRVKKYNNSEIVETGVNILFAAIFAYLIYLILGLLFGSTSPLVIVFSASMEPNLYRGDVIALGAVNENHYFGPEVTINKNIENESTLAYANPVYNGNKLSQIIFEDGTIITPDKNGEIIVYNSFPYNLPIIHRSIVKINALDGEFVLTKGDNQNTNPTFDSDCGQVSFLKGQSEKSCITFKATKIDEIYGVAFGRVPFLGCIKLWLVDDLISLITTGQLPKDFSDVC